jgi:hypothetical protein
MVFLLLGRMPHGRRFGNGELEGLLQGVEGDGCGELRGMVAGSWEDGCGELEGWLRGVGGI